jgi:hypothetical protein
MQQDNRQVYAIQGGKRRSGREFLQVTPSGCRGRATRRPLAAVYAGHFNGRC